MSENNSPTDAGQSPIAENLRIGLALLWQASNYAQDASADPWDFALEINSLYEAGTTISDLRWLVTRGYAQHGQETSEYGDPHRSFRPSDGLNFAPTTCFVLTPQGGEFAGKQGAEPIGVSQLMAVMRTLASCRWASGTYRNIIHSPVDHADRAPS